MRVKKNNIETFFALMRAGLFPVHGSQFTVNGFDLVDWGEVYRLAEEQSVVGLIADAIDRFKVQDSRFKVPQEWALQFVGQTLQLEQRNKAMNVFIADLVEEMRKAGIYTLLLKGQGVAQCYERPLWRACGDVDFFLSEENYAKAKEYLLPLASSVEPEGGYNKHQGMTIDGWVVELHGNLRSGLSGKVDKELDGILNDTFMGGSVRSWMDGRTQVFLLSPTNDAVYVFTHILQHFYKGGIGLRQVCDWCRLLYRYRGELDLQGLESRIRKMGLMSAWCAFGALAIDYLGFPKDSMPLLNVNVNDNDNANDNLNLNANLKRKADRIMAFILKTGKTP